MIARKTTKKKAMAEKKTVKKKAVMISLKDFHQDFLQSILSDAESRGLMKPQSFFENICEDLLRTGDLTNNYTAAEFSKRGLEVYGYDYDEERKILSLLANQFFQEEEIQTLTKNQIDTKFKRLKEFFHKCTDDFYRSIEETSEAYSMAYNIYDYCQKNQIDKVRLILLTDGKATRNLSEIASETNGNIMIEFRVVDIEYIYKIYMSENNNVEFVLKDVDLPCLEILDTPDEYESYLSVLPGEFLFKIYEKFGQRLLEQNVRTFLQFRGGVNKGLRNTIEFKPEMFFAYNNGITATAEEIVLNKKGNIGKIKNFQIVNGGQTTSAIYAAKKTSKIDISKIYVQMKLSVVKDKEKEDKFVSKVSEYANTQNKVNKSDFFSNNPFHKEFKEHSKKIWVSAVGGTQRRTHWFYERVRGEYLNEQAYLSVSEKKRYQMENPKHQLFDKTFLAKCENAWSQKPYIVSKGAQYSFVAFADHITGWLEKDELAITEQYFKDSVSKVILFRTVEKLVSKAKWYDGGFRAQTVAYTISYLSYVIKQGSFLNFELIWNSQKLPDSLIKILEDISERIYCEITSPPEGHANVAQWCKKQTCWDKVKTLEISVTINKSLLIGKVKQQYSKRKEKKEKKLLNGIKIQAFVVESEKEMWKKLFDHYEKYRDSSGVSPMQMDILEKMSHGALKPPSEKQAKILYQLYERAEEEGVAV